jgi:hypothetical protein
MRAGAVAKTGKTSWRNARKRLMLRKEMFRI